MLNFKRAVLGLIIGTTVVVTAFAQKQWPTGPVTIIVPFGTGNGLDIMARSYAVELGKQLNVPVVVDNKEGAGGLIGTMAAARAAPNGQTIMFTAEYPFLTTPYMQAGQTYDPVANFSPIAKVASSPHVLVVAGNSKLRTVDDLVKYSRANPGKLSFASSGVGTPSHLYMERFIKDAGIVATHVPYKSTATATTDVMSGHVELYLPSLSGVMPFLLEGKLHALAVGSSRRVEKLPNVPTIAELLKKPGLDAYVWFGFLAPKGTPAEVVTRLEREINTATSSSAVAELFAQADTEISPAVSRRFASEILDGDAKARTLLNAAGVATK